MVAAAMLAGCASPGASARVGEAPRVDSFPGAVERYRQALLARPDDVRARRKLSEAEAAWLDDTLARFEAATGGGADRSALTSDSPPLRLALSAMTIADGVHRDVVAEDTRRARLGYVVSWTGDAIGAVVWAETSRGRALAARERRDAFDDLLTRPELAAVRAALDVEIARAGQETCLRATEGVLERGVQPFSLDLVAAYCASVNGPRPASPAKSKQGHVGLVSGIATRVSVNGLPADEAAEMKEALSRAFESSPWFSPRTSERGALQLEGEIAATLSSETMSMSRPWVERTPYQTIETKHRRVEGTSTVHAATMSGSRNMRLRPVMFTFPEVRYIGTNERVTKYRETPRIFEYTATKHHGEYRARIVMRVRLGAATVPVEVRHAADDARDAFEHDVEFVPAGVKPHHADVPTAKAWREAQRLAVTGQLGGALEAAYRHAFCSGTVATPEDAARCARARPREVPAAVRSQLALLIADDPDRVLALPRTHE